MRHKFPQAYPLTGFFDGQNWMGCCITKAIKEFYANKQRRSSVNSEATAGEDIGPSSSKKAKTDSPDSKDDA
jgi:hypothetical protein